MPEFQVVTTAHGKFSLPVNFVQIERRSGLSVYYASQVLSESTSGLDLPELTNQWLEITVAYPRGLPLTDFLERCEFESENPLYPALRRVLGVAQDTRATVFIFGRRRDRQLVERVPTGVPVPLSAGEWELLAMVCKPG